MKEAHRMTREIKAEFPEVDYSFQLSLCLEYLLAQKVIVSDPVVLNEPKKCNFIKKNIYKDNFIYLKKSYNIDEVIEILKEQAVKRNIIILKYVVSEEKEQYKIYYQTQIIENKFSFKNIYSNLKSIILSV